MAGLSPRFSVPGSGNKTAHIWDMVDGSSKVLTINDTDPVNNDAGVTSITISPNGQLVAAGSLDTVMRIWDIGIGILPNGQLVAAGSLDTVVHIWDVGTGSLIECLRGHRDSIYSGE
ncbi:WD-40 repeat-containing protein, partial [Suillus placidus]